MDDRPLILLAGIVIIAACTGMGYAAYGDAGGATGLLVGIVIVIGGMILYHHRSE